MAFVVNPEDGLVPLDVANMWAARWQGFVAYFNKSCPPDKPYFPKAYLLHRKEIEKLLSEPNVENIRVYFGMDDQLNNHLMMVGVDAKGNDILNNVYNLALPCPPFCGGIGGLGG